MRPLPQVERLAIQQPYFMPYAGYFRLMAATDLLVIYDDVQFSTSGWVHRNRMPTPSQPDGDWLTLPLAKAPLGTFIKDKRFELDAQSKWEARLRSFPVLMEALDKGHPLMKSIASIYPGELPVSYMLRVMQRACEMMDIPFHALRASEMPIPPELHGEERVLEIIRLVGARTYINPAGGQALYTPEKFVMRNMHLCFFQDYGGSMWSILYRLVTEDPMEVRKEIFNNLDFIETRQDIINNLMAREEDFMYLVNLLPTSSAEEQPSCRESR